MLPDRLIDVVREPARMLQRVALTLPPLALAAGCASTSTPASTPPKTSPAVSAGQCARGVLHVPVHITRAQPPVCVQPGARIVAQLPPNPMGTWTKPSIDHPNVVRVTSTPSARGVRMVIRALAPGRAQMSTSTTPPSDPRPRGDHNLRWQLTVTVRS